MALTYTTDIAQFEGNKRVVRGLVTFDSSYPTGGEAFSLASIGMHRLDDLKLESDDGVLLEWDRSKTSPKIKAYRNVGTFTDSSGGTAGTTVAAGVGKYILPHYINLASITGAGDVLTTFTVPHKFKILSFDAFVVIPATTAAKAVTLNLEIGTTDLTGGAIALTSANCTPMGAKIAGSAITAANTGAADATVSIEAASVTAFVEGTVMVQIHMQNMDTADAFATLLTAGDEVANTVSLSGVTARFEAIGG